MNEDLTAGVPASLPPFFWTLGEGQAPPDAPATAIGHDEGSHLLTTADGTVVSTSVEGLRRSVNSSPAQFLDSLEVLRAEWAGRSALDEEQANEQTRALRVRLATIDPTALSDRDSWWSLVLEQMEHGLL